MVRIAVVEDDDSCATLLDECIKRYGKKNGVEFAAVRFSDAEQFLFHYNHDYDMIFMDIAMPGINGMEASHKLRKFDENVALIFVTSLAQYAVEGYDVNALDFIVKPVNYYSFKLKMKKALAYLSTQTARHIILQDREETTYIKTTDLMYVEVQGHNVIYHTKQGTLSNAGSLKSVEAQLEGAAFFRCNYCYLVNLHYVSGVKGNVVTVCGDELQISRNRKAEFLKRLSVFYGNGGR